MNTVQDRHDDLIEGLARVVAVDGAQVWLAAEQDGRLRQLRHPQRLRQWQPQTRRQLACPAFPGCGSGTPGIG